MSSAKSGIFCSIQKFRQLSSFRRGITGGRVMYTKPSQSEPKSNVAAVPGLSGNVVQVIQEPVGPGAGKATNYKNPEYFCYNNTSYFEAEVEMLKYRCPQPSSKK
ncbi:PREDICTED: NADH dehydrogenase [ubiquinone] flavoprotein 3, mitochondrial [Nicrophorus vespilloides]|uniref:NADH dehydrogenase [ubiquinone] flavoprotein 3, mitochondrial n=1 Tax=Nicrophorus vespilloides TaxID=110193 RepID=A0ABM1MM13_NICVS|nr:PREDICTED: NADH dehydrogenase [ubiquinone] flavoprotein 3, mitochondrial [Nicrophorus vespilloides]